MEPGSIAWSWAFRLGRHCLALRQFHLRAVQACCVITTGESSYLARVAFTSSQMLKVSPKPVSPILGAEASACSRPTVISLRLQLLVLSESTPCSTTLPFPAVFPSVRMLSCTSNASRGFPSEWPPRSPRHFCWPLVRSPPSFDLWGRAGPHSCPIVSLYAVSSFLITIPLA